MPTGLSPAPVTTSWWVAAFHYRQVAVADRGVRADGDGGKRRQRGDGRVRSQGAGRQPGAEVAVGNDADVLTALDQRAGLTGLGHRGGGFGDGGLQWATTRWASSDGAPAATPDRPASSGRAVRCGRRPSPRPSAPDRGATGTDAAAPPGALLESRIA